MQTRSLNLAISVAFLAFTSASFGQERADEIDLQQPLDAYVKQLKTGNPAERKQAVEALGTIADRASGAVPALAKCLEAEHPHTRIYAANFLWQLSQDPAALVVLTEELKNQDVQVRLSVVEILVKCGPEAKAAAPALEEALGDTVAVRSLATLALWRIAKHPKVLPTLIGDLKSDWLHCNCALHRLAEIGAEAKPAVPALLETLQGTSSENRDAQVSSAALALWRIDKHPAVVPALMEELKKSNPSYAIGALKEIGREDAKCVAPALREALKHEQESVRRSAASVLVAIGPEPADPALSIANLKHQRDDVRKLAAIELGELGARAKSAVPALIEAAKEQTAAEPEPPAGASRGYLGLEKVALDLHVGLYIEELRPDSPAEKAGLQRFDAVNSINGIRVFDLKQYRAVLDNLDLNPDDMVTFSIQRGDEEPRLVALTASERPKPGTLRVLPGYGASRVAAAVALWKIDKHPAAIPSLISALKDPSGGQDAALALRAIGVDAKSAVPALLEAVKEENVYRRVSAAEALWKIEHDPAAPAALVEFLKKSKPISYDPIYAAKALWDMVHNPVAQTALLRILNESENHSMRDYAAEALWQINRHPAALPKLAESQSIHALAAIAREGTSAKAALDEASNDDDAAVRALAANWLKRLDQSGAPRTEKIPDEPEGK